MGQMLRPPSKLPVEGRFPSLVGATAWLNSPPLDPEGLQGKVVLVDFCTYTCINWLRTLPYVRAWAEKYRDLGLVLIGAHTPEFSFESDLDNVRQVLAAMAVEYPVAVDNGYAIWDAFANHYWPALYFIDATGRIRHHWFGEGDYERSETVIQQLLADAGTGQVDETLVAVDPLGPEVEADWDNLRSPETYLGYGRTQNFGSPDGMAPRRPHIYAPPDTLPLNHWALSGNWTANPESVVLHHPKGVISFRFHARDVHLVMGPMDGSTLVAFRVSIDGEPPRDASGSDVNDDGAGLVTEPRMYQLVRQRGPITDRLFAIEFLDRGAEAFAFTFG
jgi:thiol-disulfide isomerase/thioredoxin